MRPFWLLALVALALNLSAMTARAQLVTLDVRVSANSDDAEEASNGSMRLTDVKLEVGSEAWVGFRFNGVTVPRGATIMKAYLQFRANETNSVATPVTIFGHDTNNASTFTTGNDNISNRSRTSASVSWSVPTWTSGADYQTPEIRAIVQEIVDRGSWHSGNSMALLFRSESASGERNVTSRDSSSTLAAILHIEYTTETPPQAPDLLFVVANASRLSTEEQARLSLLQGWAYNVTTISASSSAASFATAAAANDAAYVSATVDATELGTKLASAALGIVNEQPALHDEFGLASAAGASSASSLTLPSMSHYLTSAFSAGRLAITSSSQPVSYLSGTLSPDLAILGSFGGETALATLEATDERYDTTLSPGRRVAMPWGDASFHVAALTSDGQNLLRRAIVWAAGRIGHWKLDETSGTTATDSSNNANNGSLSGGSFSFATSGVSPAKVDGGLDFNGSNNLVTVADADNIRLETAFSITAWIKGDAWGSGGNLDSILRKGGNSSSDYGLAIRNGRATIYVDENDNNGDQGDTTLQVNKWYHIAVTWDGANTRIYVDGVLDHSPPAAHTSAITPATNPLRLGGRSGGDYFDGVLDDIRLFNYALGTDEIAKIMASGHGDSPGVRVLNWLEVQ